ncbi:MAG: transposase, partial [Desulfarculus sp.]|nr:transposase [Desulfarculus sp.]
MAKKSGTQLERFIMASVHQEVWIGLDVHKTSWHVAIFRADGQVCTFTTTASPDQFVGQLLSWALNIKRVVYEAGPTGFVLALACRKAGIKVGVIAPSRAPWPVTRGAKTDRLDCIKLAEFAAKEMFPRYIAIPTIEEESIRSLQRHRFHLVDKIRKVKSRIKGLLLEFGIPEPKGLAHWSGESVKELDQMQLQPGANETLHSHLRELKWLLGEMKGVEASLEQLVKESE